MKKLLIFLIGFLATGVLFAQDMKLEEILAKAFKATGQDKFEKFTTYKVTMKWPMQGIELAVSMYRKQPNLLKIEAEFQGARMVNSFDGKNGWMINPSSGTLDPVDMPPDQVKDFDDESSTFLNWKNPLFKSKDIGSFVELKGSADMGGIRVFKIKVTDKDNDTMNYYIDAGKFLVIKEESFEKKEGQTETSEDIYSDFREVEGIMVPFRVEEFINGQSEILMIVEKYEFNLPLENSFFSKPVPNP